MTFVKFLEYHGWEFFQDSPDSGKWFLFSPSGKGIAREGDDQWNLMRAKYAAAYAEENRS